MSEDGVKNKLGPLWLALFQDIPHIIDTVWHWAEFYANRMGTVALVPPYDYRPRPTWHLPIFGMFVAVSAFLIFGQTADSFCLLGGPEGMAKLRMLSGIVAWMAVLLVFMATLDRAMLELALGAEMDADQFCAGDDRLAETRRRTDALRRKVQEWLNPAGFLLGFSEASRAVLSNTLRVLVAVAFLPAVKRVAVVCAALMLVVGTAFVVTPFGSVAWTLMEAAPAAGQCPHGSPGPLLWQCGALIVCASIGGYGWSRLRGAFPRFLFGCVLWAAVLSVLWGVVASARPSEASGGPYPNVYAAVVATLLVVAAIARMIADRVTRGLAPMYREPFVAALETTDLHTYRRDQPDIDGLRCWSGLLGGISRHVAAWLLLPAFVVFVAPSRSVIWSACLFLVLSCVLITYGELSTRWAQMLTLVERWFLRGTARVVSYFVIVVAALRLDGVQYVTTLLDAVPFGVVFVIVLMTYVAIWYYEYWINRWIAECLLGILGTAEQAREGWVGYALKRPDSNAWSAPDGRILELHGTGWFCAQGYFLRTLVREGERSPEHAFTLYSYGELFVALDRSAYSAASHDILRRIRLYFSLVNSLLVVVVGLLLWWRADAFPPMKSTAVVEARTDSSADAAGFDLAQAMLRRTGTQRPVIAVAASGGGTRAAVFAAVAMEGLARLGAIEDVVLLSGVSGGGVALAAFASDADRLRSTLPGGDSGNPWQRYVERMGEPFIQDVLEGSGELRIAGGAPLGLLLQESLERRVFAGSAETLGALRDVGLILNTTVTGHPYRDSTLIADHVGVVSRGGSSCERTYSFLAGGRLIFTNLTHIDAFPRPQFDIPDMNFNYRVIRDPGVGLSSAGALTANFPPVFPNARVVLKPASQARCESDSYFVTDGGATENLGLVSALYGIESAIDRLDALGAGRSMSLPTVHLVAIEASAVGYDYSDDRGVGAATGGAKERINAGLTHELIGRLSKRLEGRGSRLEVHYVTLPFAFRSRGGFGTHWMFPGSMEIANPLLAEEPSRIDRISMWLRGLDSEFVDLDRADVLVLWRALFDPHATFCTMDPHSPTRLSNDARQVAGWMCGRDSKGVQRAPKVDWQITAWAELARQLRRH